MSKIKKLTKEQLEEAVAKSTSFSQLTRIFNIKGGSGFPLLKKRVEELGIDTSHFKGKTWNKGLTKETHSSIKRGSENQSKTMIGRPGHPHTLESRQKLSESAKERSWANGLIRTKWLQVFNPYTNQEVYVQGTWEKAYVEYLNEQGVKWIRNKSMSFIWSKDENDIKHSYHPDFYLPESDQYVEIKGFMWKSTDGRVDDELKLRLVQEQNPQLKLVILMKNELRGLGIKIR